MLVDQFTDLLILILLAAAVIAGLIGEPQDSIAILVIVFLNAIFGAVQEFRAERAVAAVSYTHLTLPTTLCMCRSRGGRCE